MVFEIQWLVIYAGTLTMIFGFILLILMQSSKYIKGPGYWAVGAFIMGASLLYYSIYPWPSEYYSIIITNVFFIVNKVLYLIGVRKFKGKTTSNAVFLLPLISVVQVTVFTQILPYPNIRLVCNGLLYAFCIFLLLREMIYPPDKSLKKIFIINAITFALMGFVTIFRAILATQNSEKVIMENTALNAWFLLISITLHGILTYGFIIMVNTKVADDLKKQIAIKDMFFSIIAHDLNNQINIIKGFSELLYANSLKQDAEKSTQFAGYIRQASLQTTSLLANLLDWSHVQNKKEIFNPEQVNLNELITDEIAANSAISDNKQIIITYHGTSSPIMINADKNMIKTTLRNLIINAIKFTNQGGAVAIAAKLSGSHVEVSVTDSGIGIKPEVLNKLLTSFLVTTEGTNKEAGHGLGLFLCRQFVEKHGGKIWIESTFEVGSSVKFTIPL